MCSGRKAIVAILLASLAFGGVSAPIHAQEDARIRKIESEVRALQRVVFPGGQGKFFNPEVLTPNAQAQPQAQVGTPSTTPLVDVLARLDTLETQVAQMVARTEENENAIAMLRQELAALKGGVQPDAAAAGAPAAAAPAGVTPTASTAGQLTGVVTPPAARPAVAAVTAPATTAPAAVAAPARPAAAQPSTQASTQASTKPAAAVAPSAARLARVQAVLKPATADVADDEYTYGFRLWEAKLYPEAQQQLASYLQKYPTHARVSFGRNLLGRAYLDEGKPREAATYFFQNYQANKQGDRAPDSLLFLAESMVALNDSNRACIALAEFGDTYPALATGRLKDQYDRTRGKARCG